MTAVLLELDYKNIRNINTQIAKNSKIIEGLQSDQKVINKGHLLRKNHIDNDIEMSIKEI